jgi:hypothetical protein
MKAVLDMYQNAYRTLTPALNPFEFMQPAARAAAASSTETSRSTHELDLQKRIEELEAVVAKMTEGNTARRGAKANTKNKARGRS